MRSRVGLFLLVCLVAQLSTPLWRPPSASASTGDAVVASAGDIRQAACSPRSASIADGIAFAAEQPLRLIRSRTARLRPPARCTGRAGGDVRPFRSVYPERRLLQRNASAGSDADPPS